MMLRQDFAQVITTAVTAALALSSCGPVKKLDEMGKTTEKMSGTTEKMSGTTERMSTTTEEMAGTTEHMAETTDRMAETTETLQGTTQATYADIRQGSSMTIRSERIEAMEQRDSIEAKLSEASMYFMAFEYQLWKVGVNDPAALECLYADAVTEFMHMLREYVRDRNDLNPGSTDPRMENLYALAAALHRVNANQEADFAAHDRPTASMLGLIEQALRLGAEVREGRMSTAQLPRFALEVLRSEQDAIYILRLRHNFLAAMPLASISRIEEAGGFLGLRGFARKGLMYLRRWHPTQIQELNASQLEYMNLVLEHSIKARAFLRSIQVDPRTDGRLLRIYRNMRIEPGSASGAGIRGDDLINRFKAGVNDLLERPAPAQPATPA